MTTRDSPPALLHDQALAVVQLLQEQAPGIQKDSVRFAVAMDDRMIVLTWTKKYIINSSVAEMIAKILAYMVSPCVGKCIMQEGRCTGCGRSEVEITAAGIGARQP